MAKNKGREEEKERKRGSTAASLVPSLASSLPFNFTRCLIIIATSLGSFSRSLLPNWQTQTQRGTVTVFICTILPLPPSLMFLFDRVSAQTQWVTITATTTTTFHYLDVREPGRNCEVIFVKGAKTMEEEFADNWLYGDFTVTVGLLKHLSLINYLAKSNERWSSMMLRAAASVELCTRQSFYCQLLHLSSRSANMNPLPFSSFSIHY